MKGKALFLLVIFLLNTVVGVACALHLSPDFDSSEVEAHEHGTHTHSNDHHHSADKATSSLLKLASLQNLTAKEHACCKDDVNTFNLSAKNISSAGNTDLKVPVYFILPQFFSPNLQVVRAKSKTTIFATYRKPPSSVDIRVSISSFLI
ncbi:hypothetical protein [Pedobacter nutrimenti]|nr:hypothetical protein [Pedobacter nutrimenti]